MTVTTPDDNAQNSIVSDPENANSVEEAPQKKRGKGAQQKVNRQRAKRKQRKRATVVEVAPPAIDAKMQSRHKGMLLSLFFVVVLPSLVLAFYLFFIAEDRFSSTIGFTVRQDEAPSASDLLGGLSGFTSSGVSTDADIVNEYLVSQTFLERVDQRLELKRYFSQRANSDPLFSLKPEATIEDLINYWERTVRVAYDRSTGMTEVEVIAFDPEMAQTIAAEILVENQRMVNELNAAARREALEFAQLELDRAEERLQEISEKQRTFRSRTQILDLESELQGRMGVLFNLQELLAQELVSFDELTGSTHDNDPRVKQAEKRLDVIQQRINAERIKLSNEDIGATGEDYPELISEFQDLEVERGFAEQSYVAALTTFDSARVETLRQSRYLAVFVEPTLAERSEYPRRVETLGLFFLFAFLIWSVCALIYYSVRDRG